MVRSGEEAEAVISVLSIIPHLRKLSLLTYSDSHLHDYLSGTGYQAAALHTPSRLIPTVTLSN